MRILLTQVPSLQCTTTRTTPLTSPHRGNKKIGILLPKDTQNWKPLSTPVKLGIVNRRWMEYQGIKNWDGLLDPLDENLRGEIIRYGQFVDAAYKIFERDHAMCRFPKKTLFQKSGLPHTGYHITKNLHATSGIDLPHWTEKVPRGWPVPTQSSWIGYVAVCNDKKEIARLGRRDVVIALRGTATCLEWLENLRATLTGLPGTGEAGPMVECGFLSLYTSGSNARPSLQELIRNEIRQILETYCDEPLSLTVTGHSLGAALAVLAAYDIKTTFRRAPLVTVISFGGPRVGNQKFRHHVENVQGTKILRIVNSDDIVTKVPGFVSEEDYSEWAYADVGRELRLTSRASPYLSQGFNVATCHELGTYLHLVNGFVSSTCPFRGTATKMTKDVKER